MRNFHVIKEGMDVNALALAIAARPELWTADDFLRNYPQGPFGETDSILLRFPEIHTGMSEEDIAAYKENRLAGLDQHESVFRDAWHALPQAHQFVFDLAQFARAVRIGRVMINRIRPGGRIFRHPDTPEHCRYYKRFHLVIQGMPGAVIYCGEEEDGSKDEAINMTTGMLFTFRNDLYHEVRNESPIDRLSMVIDLHLGSNASRSGESQSPTKPAEPRARARKRS